MPKSGATRYQKFQKLERAKTKLKSKKELPKGTNITKTNFKVKKIVLREQLKKHDLSEGLSTRKLNVKDLLSRLNHFNTHSRTDALAGLKELLTARPDVLVQNLGQLIHGVTPMVLNFEKVVRQESFKVLHLILSNVSPEKIDPFFDIMSTYLRSAMTHIDSRIQEDSLLFLDILLLCTTEKIAQDFLKIIPNFLDMISKLRVSSKPERILTVNLNSQITSVKWRVKVLHRLKDFLIKLTEYHNKNNSELIKRNTHFFNDTNTNYFSLFNSNYTSICYVSCFSPKTLQNAGLFDEVEKFKVYIDTLMPLLFETWVEVSSKPTSDNNIETVINEDAAVLLHHILEVITLLLNLTKYLNNKYPGSNILNSFYHKYKNSFNEHIIHSFPYVTNIRSKQRSNLPFEDIDTDPKLILENLTICHLFILFNPNVSVKNQNKDINSVLKYIEKILNRDTQDKTNDSVIKILHSIFSREITSWTKNATVMDALFRKIIWVYFNKSCALREKIFTLLCEIALNDKLSHFHCIDAYETWLKELPGILLEETITMQTINIIHQFAVRNNSTFNNVIKPKLLNIIENLPKIVVVDSTDFVNCYHKLFSILYWIKCWSAETLNLLEKQLLDNVYKSDHGKYIFDTLKLRSGGIFE